MTHAEEFKSLQDFLAKAIVVSLTRSTLFENITFPWPDVSHYIRLHMKSEQHWVMPEVIS